MSVHDTEHLRPATSTSTTAALFACSFYSHCYCVLTFAGFGDTSVFSWYYCHFLPCGVGRGSTVRRYGYASHVVAGKILFLLLSFFAVRSGQGYQFRAKDAGTGPSVPLTAVAVQKLVLNFPPGCMDPSKPLRKQFRKLLSS